MAARENEPQIESTTGIPRATLWLMTVACTVTVANLYFNQPLLSEMGRGVGLSSHALGLVPTMTQVGYALGMLLLVPLGDSLERRTTAVAMASLAALPLAGVALAQGAATLIAMSFLVGVTTMVPQLLIPFAADIALPAARGRVVGIVMSGLLVGILLSRTVAGFVGAHFGWRVVFGAASALCVAVAISLQVALPVRKPNAVMPYPQLLRSIVKLAAEEPTLRLHAFIGAMSFGAFSAFWATLSPMLEATPHHYGSDVAGMFGVVGLVGVIAAPIVGRVADRRADRRANGLALLILLFSFLVLALAGASLLGIGAGVVLLDLGAQSNHISNQARVFSLRPDARSRINTVYMFSYFVGGAAGAYLGALGFSLAGRMGVYGVGAAMTALGLIALVLFGSNARDKSVSVTL